MTNKNTFTEPITELKAQTSPTVVVPAAYRDEKTGALYVHRDLSQMQKPWEEENHIGPMNTTEKFGDVESFVAFVMRYGGMATLLTWNSSGIKAVLDYAQSSTEPGHRAWSALHPFKGSPQWEAWKSLTSGKPVSQREAVERLEDLAEDIVSPPATDVMAILRNLRASVNAKADTELRPDGTTNVSFMQDKQVKAVGLDLPPSFEIAVPVLKGHVDIAGKPVVYRVPVRLRVSIDDNAHLAFRFSIPTSERILEAVYEDRINAAKALFGAEYRLLRASDS